MDTGTIAALALAERRAEHQAARDPHRERRVDALRERDRYYAARARSERWRRMRAALARGIRRLAEAVEPPRQVRVSGASEPC